MAKSGAERQKEFRAKSKDKFKRLDTLLPVEIFNMLHGNATGQGLTKVAYIAKLLHGNSSSNDAELLAANEKLRIKNDELNLLNRDKNSRIMALESQVKELERVTVLDRATLDAMRAERDKLLHGNEKKAANVYDGNTKGFRAEVERVTGISQANRSKFANKLKSTYAATGVTPQKNGRLSSDAERISVIEWLRDDHNLK